MGTLGRRHAGALALCAMVAIAAPADADDGPTAQPRTDEAHRTDWGTRDRILTHVGYTEFQPYFHETVSDTYNVPDHIYGLYVVGGPNPLADFTAIAHVPSGAVVAGLELDYCDNDPLYDVELFLLRCHYLGTDCVLLSNLTSAGAPTGCHPLIADLTGEPYTMDNNVDELLLVATLFGGTNKTQVLGAYIGYKLQIGPAPATPTFGDVPATHVYFRAIEALAASGITGGCGNGNYCPNQNVTRGEMAAFLARALGLHFPN